MNFSCYLKTLCENSFFFFLAMWDLSSTRDWPQAPVEVQSLSHWTAREVLCASSWFESSYIMVYSALSKPRKMMEKRKTCVPPAQYALLRCCCGSAPKPCLALCDPVHCTTPLSFTVSRSLLKVTSIELSMLSVSSSAVPFSSCPQSFPASGSFPVNWLFTSGGQSTGASASASVLPMNTQGWFPLGLTSLIS